MHKFQVEAEFSLTTTIEAESVSFDEGDTLEFDDQSYFSGEEVTCSGGDVRFVVEADDEDDAERKAEEIISEGNEVTDYNGLTWLIEGVNFTIEQVEEPMTLERATAILSRLTDDGEASDEIAEAVSFILKTLADQAVLIAAQRDRLNRLGDEVKVLQERAHHGPTAPKEVEMQNQSTWQAGNGPRVTGSIDPFPSTPDVTP